ncbi:hypothetical protein [Alkalimonas amylolytica]|uniref:DUF3352 domain-containing protein n=1 Tax=Alkalimonas amylolytica TaxID=152573 RepID=A0A1H4D8G0_ALKAM|nr:hypothetical protein [Alkalimonas amylolytica]SEA68572.1 hypothetical protein SAMN04488051_105106 [Alkalimonas amylolytica]
MRTLIIAAALLAAALFAYMKLTANGVERSSEQLSYIPADTALLTVQQEPFDLVRYLKQVQLYPQDTQQTLDMLTGLLSATDNNSGHFLGALLENYLQIMNQPEQLTELTGIGHDFRSLFYLVGLSPVSRVQLADEQAFWRFFDRVEQQSQLWHQAEELDGVAYRRYPLFPFNGHSLDLLVTAQHGWGTLVLTSSGFDPAHHAEALAIRKPADALNWQSTVAPLAKRYQLQEASFGMIRSAELLKAITSNNQNRLARDLHALFDDDLTVIMADWQTTACQADTAAIAANWPGIYFDNQLNKQPMSSRMLIASSDKSAIASLSKLRGFIAPHVQQSNDTSLLQLALGLNISQLLPAVGELWAATSNASLQCAPLVELQTAMKASNPMAALAMAGMAGSVKGASFTLNDIQMDPATGMPAVVDGLFSLSADNAHSLLQSLLMFYPPLADMPFPAQGEELELNELFPMAAAFGMAPKLMLTQDHALIYQGEQASRQAKALAGTALSQNGLLHFGMNYARFFTAMADSMAATGAELPPEFEAMKDTPFQLDLSLDIEAQGIAIESRMHMDAKAD